MFLKTYKTEFDEFIITFRDWNSRPLEIEGKINLKLTINKQKWHVIPQNQENMLKYMDFFSFARNLFKAAFILTYILITYKLLVNKIKCKCPHLYIKT